MSKRIDLSGAKFGRWTVIDVASSSNPRVPRWRCRCECGTESDVTTQSLTLGQSKSCGCLRADLNMARTLARKKGTPEYNARANMIARCTNPAQKYFKYYGGRGIRVCERWLRSFDDFLSDMGPKPSPAHQIDRKDNDGDYEPGNCRWATKEQNARNRRNNHVLFAFGESKPLAEWADDPRCPVNASILRDRVNRLKWDSERAITAPRRAEYRRTGLRRTPG